jgi:hypothetical protein
MNDIALLDTFYYNYNYKEDDEIHIFKILEMPNNDSGDCLILFDDGSSGYFSIKTNKKGVLMFDDYLVIKEVHL